MAKSKIYKKIAFCSKEHDYPIIIGSGLLKDTQVLHEIVRSKQIMLVTNKTIQPLYMQYIEDAFSDAQLDVVILEDGEAYKNNASLLEIYNELINKQHHRDTTLLALGGGVIGDITGFAAATYQRGVKFIQIPTTLLAQVDASVGGKTAINYGNAKNMIGSFYQPHAVLIDVNTLQTLPEREFYSGFAEVIKYALLEGGTFLETVQYSLTKSINASSPELMKIIAACCESKTRFVEGDEKEAEAGKRVLLNLGHTFAHALEAYTQYMRWLHGEAVAIGLYCAALLSWQLGHIDIKTVFYIDELLALANLPRRIPDNIDLSQLQHLMLHDKKTKNNTLRFVLLKRLGCGYLEEKVTEAQLDKVLKLAVG